VYTHTLVARFDTDRDPQVLRARGPGPPMSSRSRSRAEASAVGGCRPSLRPICPATLRSGPIVRSLCLGRAASAKAAVAPPGCSETTRMRPGGRRSGVARPGTLPWAELIRGGGNRDRRTRAAVSIGSTLRRAGAARSATGLGPVLDGLSRWRFSDLPTVTVDPVREPRLRIPPQQRHHQLVHVVFFPPGTESGARAAGELAPRRPDTRQATRRWPEPADRPFTLYNPTQSCAHLPPGCRAAAAWLVPLPGRRSRTDAPLPIARVAGWVSRLAAFVRPAPTCMAEAHRLGALCHRRSR